MHTEQGFGDRDISLGRADAFKLVAVFDSESTSTDVCTTDDNYWNSWKLC